MSAARRLTVLAVLLALAAAGWLIWRSWPSADDEAVPVAAAPSVPAATGLSAAASEPAESAATTAPPPAPAASVPASAPAASIATPARREVWDLCGVGRMPVPPGSPDTDQPPAPLVAEPLDGWRERWLAQLAAGTPRQRALGELLQARDTLGAQAQAHWQTLADLARQDAGADPVLLYWALSGCDEVGAAACQGLPAHRLTDAAPDSAGAWLLRAQREPAAAAEAAAQLRSAAATSPQQGQAAVTALQALPPGLPSYLRPELLSWAVGVDSGMESDDAFRLLRWCGAPGLPAADAAERAATCDRLARATVVAGASETQVRAALRVGRRLGWPESALQEAQDRLGALTALAQALTQDPQPYACATVERFDQWVADVPTLGRLGALARLQRGSASGAGR